MKFKRIFLVVMDSVGIGEAHDADKFHDEGTNTFKHALDAFPVELPNLKQLGMHNLVYHTENPQIAICARAEEISQGKDTLTGHLEMMGVETKTPFRTFMERGFPDELIQELETRTGVGVIGNISASGTEIIEELGPEHIKTGKMIVYTSADSVLQIAAHEDIIPLEKLYEICKIARDLTLKEEWKVGRIIARPFTGTEGNFMRTPNRHDYALNPSHPTVLDSLKEQAYDVLSIGKISDIFNTCGITENTKTTDNLDGIHKIIDHLNRDFTGLCFANLNDFDSKYGHRRDPIGYAKSIKELDEYIPEFLEQMNSNDLLIMVADHGNDPTYIGTDHTRENIPVLLYYPGIEPKQIGIRNTFADIGATIADNFSVTMPPIGESFLKDIL